MHCGLQVVILSMLKYIPMSKTNIFAVVSYSRNNDFATGNV